MPFLSGLVPLSTTNNISREWCTPDPKNMLDSDVRWFKGKYHRTDVKWLKVHLSLRDSFTTEPWELAITNNSGYKETLRAADFQSEGASSEVPDATKSSAFDKNAPLQVESGRIPGNYFRVELKAATRPTRLKICIDSYEFDSDAAHAQVKEVTHERDTRTPVRRSDQYYGYGRPVAIIYFTSQTTKREISCSGFAVSETLFVTNYHCLSQSWQLRNAFARFNYEAEPADKQFEVKFVKLADTPNETLDYSILRLSKPVPMKYIARLKTEELSVNQPMILFQHPGDVTKQVAMEGCIIQFPDAPGSSKALTDFYHLCDSSGGSSGSPVMDRTTGEVVGLHHLGRYDTKSQNYHNLALKIQVLLDNISEPIAKEIVSSSKAEAQ
jgi:V8-like Glu-specific endopeptidase